MQSFVQVLGSAYARNYAATVKEIFEQAVMRNNAPDGSDKKYYNQQALEFVIAGDPTLKLCTSPSGGTP